ncbi:hypothetical protein NADFUDRAFT_47783 [Nadsonia fulvescens var. elongata DSM 6958]|uniref:Uncharacterized protein n=1 Tax=Nadsonia fulvescens var. elongata DSM 6958 TaxID=857566 RepID=A0A1E3PF56_9ASCO|nr:hypothetical protein NADFUDRAFT_47783 [Nadsonia fulvescens var. elongata DSM 6958]
MALYHQQHLSTRNVYVGLIKHAKFIDKRISFKNNFPHIQNVIFPLGFDTLERLLMAKYYLPEPMAQILDPFFETTSMVCLIRHADNEVYNTVSSQLNYLENIRNGSAKGVSPWWASKIHLIEPPVSTLGISSTVARDLLKQGDADRQSLEKYMLPGVLDYILEKNPYY